MRYVHVPGIIFKQQDHIDFKVQSVLSPSKPFNTLLMGSSLAEAAAINADASLGLAKPTDYTAARYNHATFLDQLSERRFQKKSTTFSSAIGGSMISDQQLILEKVFAKKKYPQNVLLIIEPRAFIDATRTPELYPVACYMKWRYKDIAHLKNINDGMDYVFSSFWTYFKYRSDFFTLATCLASQVRDPKTTAPIIIEIGDGEYNSNKSIDPKSVTQSRIYYSKAYETVDEKKFETQLNSLRNIAKMCKAKGATLTLIGAPLAKANRDQLPAKFEHRYNQQVEEMSKNLQVRFINLIDNSTIHDSDFSDYVHLNSTGAKKFWKLVIERLD